MSEVRKQCFVIMPFSQTTPEHTEEYWTRHFDYFLKLLIEENQIFEAIRSQPLRGSILNQIITNLIRSPLVIADITDHNPNVFWELGVRQSFQHGTITIAQEGTRIPFDISTKGVLFYHGDHLNNEEFIDSFKNAISDWISNPQNPDSQVLEAISARGTLYEIIKHDETIRKMEAIISENKKNMDILIEIKDMVEDNKQKKNRNQFEYVTRHLQYSAVELLITQRYLNKDIIFYNQVEIYFEWINAVNEQVIAWRNDPEGFHNWFDKEHEHFRILLTNHKIIFEKIYDKLLSSDLSLRIS